MYDTVKFTLAAVPKSEELRKHNGLITLCSRTGLRVKIERGLITYVEVSLARILNEANVQLLENNGQIKASWERLMDKIEAIADLLSPVPRFTRLDLVWQFRGNAYSLLEAHELCRYGKMRANTTKRTDSRMRLTQLKFGGDKSDLQIKMYAKPTGKSKAETTRRVFRVECQLRGRMLQRLFGGRPLETLPNFDTAYRVYRNLLLLFTTTPNETLKTSKAAMLSALNRCPHECGIFLAKSDKKTASRWRKQLAALRHEQVGIDWPTLLPPNSPPPPYPPPPIKLRIPKRRLRPAMSPPPPSG